MGVECCHDDISPHCTVGDAFTGHGVIGKNICSQKIFVSPEVLTPEMVLQSKWGRTQPEIQPSSDREQDVSRKPLEVSRNALRAEITYDPLVAHSALLDKSQV